MDTLVDPASALHYSPRKADHNKNDDDEYEYEEVTVATNEDVVEPTTSTTEEEDEYVSYYYEEVTVADDDGDETCVTYHSHDDNRQTTDSFPAATQGHERRESTRGGEGEADEHEFEDDDDDEFTRMDESVMFHRAWMVGRNGPPVPVPPAPLGREVSASSSAAFSYAHVGRRGYEFVELLDDEGYDLDEHDHRGRRQRVERSGSEWQTLASQSLFVEEEEEESQQEERSIPAPPPSHTSTPTKVRDIYWEPPLTSVGWRWCRAGGGDRRRHLGFDLLFRGRRRNNVGGLRGGTSCDDEPQFMRCCVKKVDGMHSNR